MRKAAAMAAAVGAIVLASAAIPALALDGKDCDYYPDHPDCKTETTETETTPTETTPTETTPTETTPTETTPTETTPTETTPTETETTPTETTPTTTETTPTTTETSPTETTPTTEETPTERPSDQTESGENGNGVRGEQRSQQPESGPETTSNGAQAVTASDTGTLPYTGAPWGGFMLAGAALALLGFAGRRAIRE